MTTKTPRAVIYARFSSDLQNDRSITDQIALCEGHAKREGIKIVGRFSDHAKSGASMVERDGLIDLMRAAKKNEFDMVLVESLDRISRDQEDMAHCYKRLKFNNVEIRTVNEGTATPIHVGIRGLISSMFLADLGDKVRRHHQGSARQGEICAQLGFGYRRIAGKPGHFEIDPEEAEIVKRIYSEYLLGRTTRAICDDLNREGIRPRSGKPWAKQILLGGGFQAKGILSNPIFTGRMKWGETVRVVSPDSGKRVKRRADPEKVIDIDLPHLRIVSDETFAKVATERERRAGGRALAKLGKARTIIPRHDGLLSGLIRCDVCSGHMRVQTRAAGRQRVACANAYQHGGCDHRTSYDVTRIEAHVVMTLKERLRDPQAFNASLRELHREWSKQNREHRLTAANTAKRLADVNAAIERMVEVLVKGTMPVDVIHKRLEQLTREREQFTEQARQASANANVVDLHPTALKKLQEHVEHLHELLTSNRAIAGEAKLAFRGLIDSVVMHPTEAKQPYELTVYLRTDSLLGMRPAQQAFGGERELNSDNVKPEKAGKTLSNNPSRIISLGRAKERAA